MDDFTHSVEVSIMGDYPHGKKEHSKVVVRGDGSLEHMLSAFQAALVGGGFSIKKAESLNFLNKE